MVCTHSSLIGLCASDMYSWYSWCPLKNLHTNRHQDIPPIFLTSCCMQLYFCNVTYIFWCAIGCTLALLMGLCAVGMYPWHPWLWVLVKCWCRSRLLLQYLCAYLCRALIYIPSWRISIPSCRIPTPPWMITTLSEHSCRITICMGWWNDCRGEDWLFSLYPSSLLSSLYLAWRNSHLSSDKHLFSLEKITFQSSIHLVWN